MKGKTYKSYVRSATGMLYGSKTWCLRKNEVAVSIKSTTIYGKGDVPCKVGGQEEYREADVGIEESSR